MTDPTQPDLSAVELMQTVQWGLMQDLARVLHRVVPDEIDKLALAQTRRMRLRERGDEPTGEIEQLVDEFQGE